MTSLTATAVNGFSSPISVQISGLPAGVTASPASATLTPGVAQTFMLSAASGASTGMTTVGFTGVSGDLSHTADLALTVAVGAASGPGPSSTRTRYIRTDAVTEYYQWVNSHWAVFNEATSYFFVTDPYSNQVFVIDPATEEQIAALTVPGAYSIDETPDHSTLYVGTLIGDIYTIDPVAMTVTQRYLASEIGPYGYQALEALVLSNGSLALLGAAGGIPSVDGSSGMAIWNPTTNAITIYGGGALTEAPTLPLCGSDLGLHLFGFALTPDRNSVITGGICLLNALTGQTQSAVVNGSDINIVISPNGNYLAFPVYPGSVALYNAQTLSQVSEFAVSGDTSSAANLMFSPDSTTLYVSGPGIVYAYSVSTGQQVDWSPNIVVEPSSGGYNVGPSSNPIYEVTGGTGLLGGPLEEGFGFFDTTQERTGAVGTQFQNGYLTPDTGPTAGGTAVELPDPNNFGALSGVYFGSEPATNVLGSSGVISATTPAGSPGPADVYVFTTDGGMQIVPDGFSYGPTILEVSPNSSTAEGGGTGVAFGYGLGPLDGTTIPAGLSVSVGGQAAPVVAFNGDVYGVVAQPFPLEAVAYTIPAGSSGSAASVSVTTASGTATARGPIAYLPATQQFPLAGAQLAQGIYDPRRDLYYFTDASKVQVFSKTEGQWLAPFSIPAPAGAAQRLWGLALSPDGSKLAIADINADVMYLLNPSSPASVQTFPMTTSAPQGIEVNPAGIAITDAGIAYIAADVLGGTGFSNYFELDTNTGALTNLNITGPGLGESDSYLRTVLSSDNSRVFFNNDGQIFSIDTSTGVATQATLGPGCCYGTYDLALAENQTQFSASNYLYDADLNAESFLTLNDREVSSASYVYGCKLSPDGSLLFQPSTSGMDIFDGRLGVLRNRIALPFALSANYDALVEDGVDNVLVAITGAEGDGIAVLDFSSIVEPPPLPYSDEVAVRSRLHSESSTQARSEHHAGASGLRQIRHLTKIRPSRAH